MNRDNVDTATDRQAEGWSKARSGPTVLILEMADRDEERLWDELGGLKDESL